MNWKADIIIPVWNRPVETRECLVSLIDHAPQGRLVMVDHGSDRETEALLQEFADILGERALFIRMDRNEGFLRAVNRGLSRVTSPWAVVLRSSAVVAPGFLEQLLAGAECFPDAGLLCPRILARGERVKEAAAPHELVPAEFVAVAVSPAARQSCSLFDEELDAGPWSMRDAAFRCRSRGLVAAQIPSAIVFRGEEPVFGSLARREERLRLSREICTTRWGEERRFLLFFHGDVGAEQLGCRLSLLVDAARNGDRLTVLVDRRVHRAAVAKNWHSLHDSLRFESLPALLALRSLRKRVADWREADPEGIVVGEDGVAGIEGISYTAFEQLLEERSRLIARSGEEI